MIEDARAVAISVGDEGRGFSESAKGAGFGLVGMRERVSLAGGTMEIDSAPEAGTTIRVTPPATRAGERG